MADREAGNFLPAAVEGSTWYWDVFRSTQRALVEVGNCDSLQRYSVETVKVENVKTLQG